MTQLLLAVAAVTNITIIPRTVDFGSVPVGTYTSRMVSIINNGQEPIDRLRADISGPFTFQVTNNCYGQLEPGASCYLDVTFRPMSQGFDSAYLEIYLPDGNIRSVTVQGQGR
jgi:hypothetical protein